MIWKRPETVIFPQVWWSFEAKDPDTGKTVQYHVQDLPEDRFEEVVHLMATIFIRDDLMCKSKDRINDDIVGDGFWRQMLKEKVSVVCFKESSNGICGFNILGVSEKDTKNTSDGIFGQKQLEILKVNSFVTSKADIFHRYKVDKYLSSCALLVVPKFRGLGLATEILRGRVALGRALGLQVTGAVFSAIASQRAAFKAGFVEDYSVVSEDLAKYEPFVELPNFSSPCVKFMSFRLMD